MNAAHDCRALAFLLTAALSLAGCATKPQQPVAFARISPDIAEPVRAGGLLLAAQIVPDERPIELLGELTAEGRKSFEEGRSARIANRPRASMNVRDADAQIATCVLSVIGIVICPLGLAIGGAVHGTVNGVRYLKASSREPSLLIPENEAYRLAAMFHEGATSRALAQRAARFTMPPSTSGAAVPQVVVRMKTVEIAPGPRKSLGVRIIAEAQAFPVAGIAPAPTEHAYAWTYGPLSEWRQDGDEMVRRVLNEALDMLAASIASTYTVPWESLELPAPRPVAPLSVVTAQAMSSPLPAVGDTWSYTLTEPKGRSRQARTHRVSVASVTSDTVVEQHSDEFRAPMRTLGLQGGYLISEGAVSLFSPYFNPYDAPASGAAIANIKNLDPAFCDYRWICSTTAGVTGKELVRVPAGEFEAVKVEVRQTWTPRSSQSAGGGARTLSVWYSPQTKRAVKFSSRGTGRSSILTDFDLELESYALN